MNWVRVYELERETKRIDEMQKTSLDGRGSGLSVAPARKNGGRWLEMADC
jgi:hypothetical protein